MKTLKAQLEVKTQEYEETILNWKKGEETLRRKISQWKEVIEGALTTLTLEERINRT